MCQLFYLLEMETSSTNSCKAIFTAVVEETNTVQFIPQYNSQTLNNYAAGRQPSSAHILVYTCTYISGEENVACGCL